MHGSDIVYPLIVGAGVIATITYYFATYKNTRGKVKTEQENKAEKTVQDTLNNLEKLVTALKEQNRLQARQISKGENDHKTALERIAGLEATVETLKDIPLDKIEQHMSQTNKILETLTSLLPAALAPSTVKETHVVETTKPGV